MKQPAPGAWTRTTLLYKPITQSSFNKPLSLSLSLSTQTDKKTSQKFPFWESCSWELLITMRFKKNPSLPSLEKQKIWGKKKHKNYKTKQNKTELLVVVVVVKQFVLGTTTVVTKKNTNPWDLLYIQRVFLCKNFTPKSCQILRENKSWK